ncbi:MAG: alpha/beta hydrolase [Gemmatimonadaceae bacterium]|jgi:pimeloyl-ACP methyl ester carboxylesterase|nr:alpha/beta hydrolase [Gemmatimonadaceae bacterium]
MSNSTTSSLTALLLGVAPALLSAQGTPPTPVQSPTVTPPAASAVYVRPAPPGELVDVGNGRRIHIECKGPKTDVTVVIEAGLSQFPAHGSYGPTQDSIATFAHVCTYDRAGLGWSDAATVPVTHDAMVEDLHRVLRAKALTGPLVLVGHSMGGLLVRRYAQQHPAQVRAVVLLDATPEEMLFTDAAKAERTALVQRIGAGLRGAKAGTPVMALPAGTAPEVMLSFTPEVLAAVQQEYEAIDRVPDSMRRTGGYGTLGDRPLVVVRRGKVASPDSPTEQRWRAWQEAMLSLSTRSRMVVAEQAGHAIAYEQPSVVAQVVRTLITSR